jgi:hypothetical protein
MPLSARKVPLLAGPWTKALLRALEA